MPGSVSGEAGLEASRCGDGGAVLGLGVALLPI
jgi:hypothetical protein